MEGCKGEGVKDRSLFISTPLHWRFFRDQKYECCSYERIRYVPPLLVEALKDQVGQPWLLDRRGTTGFEYALHLQYIL